MQVFSGASDAPNEDDETPDPWGGGSPVQIGLDTVLDRVFANNADIDFFRLVLP